jgi:hypothetical protein
VDLDDAPVVPDLPLGDGPDDGALDPQRDPDDGDGGHLGDLGGDLGGDPRWPGVDVDGLVAARLAEGWQQVDTVAGDPSDDAVYWLFQGYGTGTCGATSVGMIVSDILGVPAGSNQEVVDRALQLGLIAYDPTNPAWANWGGWSGMTAAQVEALIESYGVSASQYTGTVEILAQYLDAGHSIVAFIDSSELQTGNDDALGVRADHYVEVTGVDLVNGIVYLNDPGQPSGAGMAVDLWTFADAWQDSGSVMITTDFALEAAENAPQQPVPALEEPVAPDPVVAGPQTPVPLMGHEALVEQVVLDPLDPWLTTPVSLLPFTYRPSVGVWLEPVAGAGE